MNVKKSAILIIEDHKPIRRALTIAMESAGYKVVECDNGREGLRLAISVKPELVILDLGLPDIGGKKVLTELREWLKAPIVVCSACNDNKEIISALELGADDYITKPFNTDVILARIYANMRKGATRECGDPEITNGSIRMDMVRHEVHIHGEKAVFTPKEYELLRYFLINSGKMLAHRDILKDVWGAAHTEDMQYLRVYVRQLRDKIEPDISKPCYIITEAGIGYRMEVVNKQDTPRLAIAS